MPTRPTQVQAGSAPCAAATVAMLVAASPPPRRPMANSANISGTTTSTRPAT